MMPPRAALALVSLAAVAVAGTPARADDTETYVVKEGETCMEIVVKQLGDARALAELHRLNPQLGPDTPHVLRAGQVLRLPRLAAGPDARLTRKSGDVRVRPATADAWDAARRGMDLFRAWRVGAEARASAEVTYTEDQQRLQLREHTVVVIYGPERRRARTGAEVVLERGALRTRLAQLAGKPAAPLSVKTPSATAGLADGSAVIAVADDGQAMVANHEGGAIALRGAAGGKVTVASGMGSRVAKGKPPEKPRPLPPPPAWQAGAPTGFVAVDGVALVSAAWAPVANAAAYRLELSRGDALVAAAELPASVTRFELHGAPPGDYRATVATFDRDRLEGRPGAPLALVVRGVAIVAPGADAPALAAPAADDEPLPAATGTPPTPRAARGARVVTDRLTCDAGGTPASIAILGEPGRATLRCTDDAGLAYAPLAIDVAAVEIAAAGTGDVTIPRARPVAVDIAIRSDATLGDAWQVEPSPGLTVEDVARTPAGLTARVRADDDAPATGALRVVDATTQRTLGTLAITVLAAPPPAPTPETPAPAPARARAPYRFRAAAYLGYGTFADGADTLGDPVLPDFALRDGLVIGLRAAWLTRAPVLHAVELEAAAAPVRLAGEDDTAWTYAVHAVAVSTPVRLRSVALDLRAGLGFDAVTTDAAFVRDDLEPSLLLGAELAFPIDDRLSVRAGGQTRGLLVSSDDQRSLWLDVHVGVGVGF